jgi:hypothetical protein
LQLNVAVAPAHCVLSDVSPHEEFQLDVWKLSNVPVHAGLVDAAGVTPLAPAADQDTIDSGKATASAIAQSSASRMRTLLCVIALPP